MSEQDKKPSKAKVIKDFFGLKEGQDSKGFLIEYKALSPEDREQLAKGIEDGTLDY